MPFPLIPLIIAGVSAASQAQGGQKDKALLDAQAKAARGQSYSDAESLAREARQLMGTQAAAMAQAGGTYEGSNAKILRQTETLANLDRLKILYHGKLKGLGLEEAGESVRQQAYIGAGTTLLSAFSGGYTGGKTMPGIR